MSTKLKISVTKEILERSKYCGIDKGELVSTNCAIALAVRDIFPEASVSLFAIAPGLCPLGWDEINLPKNAQQFIREFDRSTPEGRTELCPIEFEIEIPERIINKINIDELRPLLQNHSTLQLIESTS